MANAFEGVRAVLFDMDGTLVETNIDFPLMKREMVALAEKYGVPASEVEGMDILAIVEHTMARLEDASRTYDARCARREAYEQLESIELVHCKDAKPVSGAVELLGALRRSGIKLGIVTRNCRRAVEISLKKAGITADVLLTRDDVPNTKPHPNHLLEALELLGVQPGEAVMVGDHLMDVQGGRAAGMATIGFLRAERPDDFFDRSPPDLVVRDLRELLACVERLKK